MIVFDGMELIGLAVMAAPLVIFGIISVIDRIISVIDRIAYSVKKRQQKRIDDAYKEEECDSCDYFGGLMCDHVDENGKCLGWKRKEKT